MKKVIISTDSTCDLPQDLIDKHNIKIQPLHVNLDNNDYLDGVDIFPDDIYRIYDEKGILPKTSAPNIGEYLISFDKYLKEGESIVHISLGSGLSSSYQNALAASKNFNNVHVIDSGNLSTGIGLLVLEACEMSDNGVEADVIAERILKIKPKVDASFVIDNLTYLYEGGRLTALEAFGANVFHIKPQIVVDNTTGNMKVGKKYRGKYSVVLKKYIHEKLAQEDIDYKRVFITHSGCDPDILKIAKESLETNGTFKEILISRAGSTISSHCGYNTLGILFINK